MSEETSYDDVRLSFDSLEQAVRAVRESLQALRDTSALRYGERGAQLISLAIEEASIGLEEWESINLLELQEELGCTERESDERWMEAIQERAS